MRAIIVGGGQLGRELAEQLANDGFEVRVLERDHAKAESLAEALHASVCCGDGGRLQDLEMAGIRSADAVFAVTDSDECNLLTIVLARDALGAGRVFASVNHPDNARVFDALGIPHVEPSSIGAAAIRALAVARPAPVSGVGG